MRDLHRHHRVDHSYKPFDVTRVATAISKARTPSTSHGPDQLTVSHFRHLYEHGLTFLTELFNLSVAGVDIPAIWKNSIIHNPDFEGREASRPGSTIPTHLIALPDSEDIGAAPHRVHRGGAGHSTLQARLQAVALHLLGPAPHFC